MEYSMLLHVEWWNTNQIFSWRVVILRPRKRDIGEKANRSRSSRGRDGGRLSPESGGPLEEEQRCAFLRFTGAGGRQCPRKTWHSTRPDSPNNWAAGMPSRRAYFLRCVHKSHPQSSSEHIWTDHDGLSQCGSQLWLHVSFWNSWNPLPLVFPRLPPSIHISFPEREKPTLERVWRKWNPCTLLVGMYIGAATMENSMEVP